MYVERVSLANIKGLEAADLNFAPDEQNHPGWAVVTGNNGSGKTALLRAIALSLLGPDQYRDVLQDLRGWVLHGAHTGTISVEVRPEPQIDTTLKGGYPYKSTFWAEVAITEDSGAVALSPTDIFRKKKKGAANGPWSETTHGWFGVGYGPFRRLYGSSPDASRMMAIPGRGPRFGTLFKEDATLGESEEWMKTLHFKRLEKSTQDQHTLDALLDLLRDDFLRRGITIDEVSSDGLLLRDGANRRMTLEEMSEGYRSALAMLVDIFRHMVAEYGPKIVKTNEDGHHFIDRPGVVLIDEVDAHLHPEWQREIGFWLTKHFPQVQFIVTTHSPLVCAAATHGRIYHLPEVGSGTPFQLSHEDFEAVLAGKPDEILLTPAFGMTHTRSPRAVAAQQRHALLMSKQLTVGELSPEEKNELEQLSLFLPSETDSYEAHSPQAAAVSGAG